MTTGRINGATTPRSTSPSTTHVMGFKEAVPTGYKSAVTGYKGAELTGYKNPGVSTFTRSEASYLEYKATGCDVKTPTTSTAGGSILDCKVGGKGDCKTGSAYADSDAAMNALGGMEAEDISRFLRSSYSYEDAERALAAFDFLDNVRDAKAYIGMKIDNGTEDLLAAVGITPQPVDEAHEEMAAFENSSYTLDDARAAIAAFNFLADIDSAKAYIGLKIINGMLPVLEEVGIKPSNLSDIFHRSGYTDENASKVLELFPSVVDLEGAREFIGRKIAHGHEDELRAVGITPTSPQVDRDTAIHAFHTSEYTRDDAFATKRQFNLASLDDAREFIGNAILSNNTGVLTEAGIRPHNFDRHDCMALFRRSTYSSSDARAALAAFDFLSSIKDAKEYIGLKIANHYEDFLREVGITPLPYDKHECLDAYYSAGYTAEACDALIQNTDFIHNKKEAREYIGLKVISGNEGLLSEWGVTPRHNRTT